MRRNLPNQLTILRAILAGVFFVVLSQYRYGVAESSWLLWLSMGIFIAAAFTDFLDGYLARRWKVESKFGRIMDPFCDKVLVLGAFIYLAGPRFVNPAKVHLDGTLLGHIVPGNMVSGVYPWMVALILARELLVTGIRGEMESTGHKFGANWSGKAKMVLQSVCVPTVIGLIWFLPIPDENNVVPPGREWITYAISGLVYLTVIVSVISGLPYITGAMKVARQNKAPQNNTPQDEADADHNATSATPKSDTAAKTEAIPEVAREVAPKVTPKTSNG